MSLHSWLQSLRSALAPDRGRRRRHGSLRAMPLRLNVELLEDRLTPSLTWAGNFSVAEYPYSWPEEPPVDLNADGLSDQVWVNYSTQAVNVQLGNADGTFTDAREVETGLLADSVVAGDFTSDGVPDLIVGGSGGGYSSALEVLPGNGDGTFAAPIHRFFHRGAVEGLADFNGDGRLDVLTTESTGNFGSFGDVLLGHGDGTFTVDLGLGLGEDFMWASVGDVNGDDRPDVAAMTYDSYVSDFLIIVYLNDGHWGPYLSVGDATVTEGNTGAVSATFTVTLSAASTQTVIVAYTTADGTATAGSDYQGTTGTLTFAPGETIKTITILVNGDRLAEPNETFIVNLSNPTNADINDGWGTGGIVDDEPRISIGDVTKSEGKKGKSTLFTFTVTLSAAYDQTVTMSFRTVDGTATTGDSDYIAKTGTLTFSPGQTTKTFTIEVKGDSKKESNETFYLDLFGNSGNSLFTKYRGIGTILNDD